MKKLLFTFLFLSSLNSMAQYTLGNTTLDTTEVYSSLNEPWEILFGADSNLWVTEKSGLVYRINTNTFQRDTLLDIQSNVWQVGESGLLGMVFSPTFTLDSLVYLSYTYNDGANNYLKVVHYIYDDVLNQLGNEIVLIDSIPANTFHDGCRLLFLPDNSLLISTGDAGNTSLSQDRNSLAGKFLRINPDGTIPMDNPNSNSPVYSSGHRNPQGLFLYNGKVYSSEHGPANDDEINIILSNRNYGWPDVQGYCNTTSEVQFCNDSNVVEPIYAWTPTVATSDIVVYDHPAIPEWRNSILLTTLKDQSIITLQLNSNGDSVISVQTHFKNEWGRLRDICIGAKGELYIATNGFSRNGNQGQHKIIKIENTNFTSLEETAIKNQFIVFPNPAYNSITIETSFKKGVATIYSSTGSLIEEVNLSGFRKVNVKDYTPGVYYLKYSIEGVSMEEVKFIKL